MTEPTGIQYIKNNPALDELKLRQWCIEQAVRWPAPTDKSIVEDLLSRAERIMKWVKAA